MEENMNETQQIVITIVNIIAGLAIFMGVLGIVWKIVSPTSPLFSPDKKGRDPRVAHGIRCIAFGAILFLISNSGILIE
jgi:hypothetical protein